MAAAVTRKRRASVFKALGHPTRLLLLEELSGGERCVCDLAEAAGADISTVSRHLTVLRNAGLVQDDKRGLKVFYSLRLRDLSRLFGCIARALGEPGARGEHDE